jgi:hypothetical protein
MNNLIFIKNKYMRKFPNKGSFYFLSKPDKTGGSHHLTSWTSVRRKVTFLLIEIKLHSSYVSINKMLREKSDYI